MSDVTNREPHNPDCFEAPSCDSCRANVAANPWMLDAPRAQGDNNRPFGA